MGVVEDKLTRIFFATVLTAITKVDTVQINGFLIAAIKEDWYSRVVKYIHHFFVEEELV